MCLAIVLRVERFVLYELTAAICQKRECYFLCHVSLTYNFLHYNFVWDLIKTAFFISFLLNLQKVHEIHFSYIS